MLISDDVGVHDTRGGIQGIDSRVDTQLRNTSRQDSGGVKMREGGSRGGIGQIVSRHIDSLDGGDGALFGGGDSFLHSSHVGGQGWLVTNSRRDTSQKSRHFRTSLQINVCY